jgi:hypothetical protein
VELNRHRIDGRASLFRHAGEGLFKRLIQQKKIKLGEVIVPEGAYREVAKAYYLLSDPYKAQSGISWTDDIKKTGLSLAAVMIVAPFQVPNSTAVVNRYIPRINELYAEAVACSITGNAEFISRNFESKLHFYNALRLLACFDGLGEYLEDLRNLHTKDVYDVTFSRQDQSKVSQAIQTGEMIMNFKVFARPVLPLTQPDAKRSSPVPRD